MPTPFYHLDLAQELLDHPQLPGYTRRLLAAERPAFLLGNTAPDVQVVSRQAREATHFFELPILPTHLPAWEVMLSKYPSLAQATRLPASQAAFLAGYLCHLQADWHWVLELFMPVFGPDLEWGSFPHRLYIHNVLRCYLDAEVLAALPADISPALQKAEPQNWLPFVEDRFLVEWRDYIASQLKPGAMSQTVAVFATRQGISPDEFNNLLCSPERMQAEVFEHLPFSELRAYRQRVIEMNLLLLDQTLQPARYKGKTLHKKEYTTPRGYRHH